MMVAILILAVIHPGRTLVGAESEFFKVPRKERKALKKEKKAAEKEEKEAKREEKAARKGDKSSPYVELRQHEVLEV
jgi:sRNA-binding protein